jgi:hypothetical protein
MSAQHLKLLLHNEFRLWKRYVFKQKSPIAIFTRYLTLCAIVSLFTYGLFYKLNQPLPLSSHIVRDNAIWVIGVFFYFFLLLLIVSGNPRKNQFIKQLQKENLLLSSPITARDLFTSILLSQLWQIIVDFSAIYSSFTLTLAYIFQFPASAIGLFLIYFSVACIYLCANYWSIWFFLKLGKSKILEFITLASNLLALGIVLFPFILLWDFDSVYPSVKWFLEAIATQFSKGHLFGIDSWLWYPVGIVVLEPLPTLFSLPICLGLVWLTIERLHRPLINAVGSYNSSEESQSSAYKQYIKKKSAKQITQFQENLFRLIFLKDCKLLFRQDKSLESFLVGICLSYGFILLFSFAKPNQRTDAYEVFIMVSIFIVICFSMGALALSRVLWRLEKTGDLIKLSPIKPRHIHFYKHLTVLILVWFFSSPLLIVLGFLGKFHLLTIPFSLAGSITASVLRSWNTDATTISQESLERNNRGEDRGLTRFETISLFIWPVCLMCSTSGKWKLVVLAGVVEGLVLLLAWQRYRKLAKN